MILKILIGFMFFWLLLSAFGIYGLTQSEAFRKQYFNIYWGLASLCLVATLCFIQYINRKL